MHTLSENSSNMLNKFAPSAFAVQPYHKMSERYGFVPTSEIVAALENEGFNLVRATESRVRLPEKRGFAKHMLRLRQNDIRPVVGDVFPEIVLTNSHDGSSAYVLEAGFYRLTCSNGAVVSESTFPGIHVRHNTKVVQEAIEGTYSIISEMPALINGVEEMRAVALSSEDRRLMARAAITARYDDENLSPINPEQLLRPRRSADASTDLWTTFNVIQENMIKGGLYGRGANGRRMHTRAIKGIDQDRGLNKALWMIAEAMKDSKKAA